MKKRKTLTDHYSPEPGSARFVADVKVGEFPSLLPGDAAHGTLKGMLAGGDTPVLAGLCLAIAFEDGDDRLFFMNVESQVEFLRCV
jgi:hypothetical protein